MSDPKPCHHKPDDSDHGHSHAHDGQATQTGQQTREEQRAQRDHHPHGHHHHHHHHHHHGGPTDNIRLAFFLNFTFSVVEIVGGTWIGSLAIVADAVHDLGDSVSLAAAWFLERLAKKGRDRRFHFGYRRFSLLSALLSSVVISVGSIVILIESIKRFSEPVVPAGVPMMALALVGLSVNGFAAWKLSRGKTQNERVLTWHLIEDVLGWAVVLIGGIIVTLTQIPWIDPALAIGLSLFVLFNVVRYLKSTLYLFLQGSPPNFDSERFLAEALAVTGVERVDHLAVWSLDGEASILSARLHLHSVHDPLVIEQVKSAVRALAAAQGAEATLETCLAAHAPHPRDAIDDGNG